LSLLLFKYRIPGELRKYKKKVIDFAVINDGWLPGNCLGEFKSGVMVFILPVSKRYYLLIGFIESTRGLKM